MKASTRRRIEAARAIADHESRKANVSTLPVAPVIPDVIVDEMMKQEKWWTFAEIKEKFFLSYDTVSREFKGRLGVTKWGSDYRVPDTLVRQWLAEALKRGQASS